VMLVVTLSVFAYCPNKATEKWIGCFVPELTKQIGQLNDDDVSKKILTVLLAGDLVLFGTLVYFF